MLNKYQERKACFNLFCKINTSLLDTPILASKKHLAPSLKILS